MSSGQAAGGCAGGGGREQLSAIGRMIMESQTLDGDGEELVRTLNAFSSRIVYTSVHYNSLMQILLIECRYDKLRRKFHSKVKDN